MTGLETPRFVATRFRFRRFSGATGYVIGFLLLFELAVWAVFGNSRFADTAMHRYLWYGTAYETKLRDLVDTPNLPSNSVLYAGWLGDGKIAALPRNADLTVYGMSFSQHLSIAIGALRPEMTQRVVAGPGAPLNHTYAAYQVDKRLGRKTRFAVVGVTSTGVEEVTTMNRGSLHIDAAFPYFYPRYKLDRGRAVLAADSLINSADELRAALSDPPAWERQLHVLEQNDGAYRRFLFASDVFDHSVLARFIRRGVATRRADAYTNDVLGPDGFRRDREAPQLFRALFQQMLDELRAENVHAIVFLVSTRGQGDHLYDLVADILAQEAVPVVNSNDSCPSDQPSSYQPDLHFTYACDLKFAKKTIDIIDATEKADSESRK